MVRGLVNGGKVGLVELQHLRGIRHLKEFTQPAAGFLRAFDDVRIIHMADARAGALDVCGLFDELFLMVDGPAQHARFAEKPGGLARLQHAAINLHRVAPDDDEGGLGIMLVQLHQPVAIKRRLLAAQRRPLQRAESLIQVRGGPDLFQSGIITIRHQPVPRQRLVVKLDALRPVAPEPRVQQRLRKIPDIAFKHQRHPGILVQDGTQQGRPGTEDTYNKKGLVTFHRLQIWSPCYRQSRASGKSFKIASGLRGRGGGPFSG